MSYSFLLFTAVLTVLFFSLWRKLVKDAQLDLRATAWFYPSFMRYLGWFDQTFLKGNILFQQWVSPLCSIIQKCSHSLPLAKKDSNFPPFWQERSSGTGMFKVIKKASKLLCDIDRLLDHQPIFLHSHLLTHFSLTSPPTHIASLVIRGGCGIVPYREPPFSLRQQPCHALGSALPMAGTGPTPGADSRSVTVPRSPSTKTAPSV